MKKIVFTMYINGKYAARYTANKQNYYPTALHLIYDCGSNWQVKHKGRFYSCYYFGMNLASLLNVD